MQKKIVTMLLILSMAAMVGCGNSKPDNVPAKDQSSAVETKEETAVDEEPVETEAPTEEETSVEAEMSAEEDNSGNDTAVEELDYETFQELSPADQQAYMEKFESMEAFFEWYSAEKEAYEEAHPSIEIDGEEIDLEEILGGDQ